MTDQDISSRCVCRCAGIGGGRRRRSARAKGVVEFQPGVDAAGVALVLGEVASGAVTKLHTHCGAGAGLVYLAVNQAEAAGLVLPEDDFIVSQLGAGAEVNCSPLDNEDAAAYRTCHSSEDAAAYPAIVSARAHLVSSLIVPMWEDGVGGSRVRQAGVGEGRV